jgi:hypothetical protein
VLAGLQAQVEVFEEIAVLEGDRSPGHG